jgi:hypothetical protein
MKRKLMTLSLSGALSACALGAEENFSAGLKLDRCDGTFPICQTSAGCVLGNTNYVEGSFPGSRQFIVPAPAGSLIAVRIFFRSQVATGVDTEILWNEPGCFDTYQYLSEGIDIFREAGKDGIFEQTQLVLLDGDHLVEVFSDATADYFISVDVQTPSG